MSKAVVALLRPADSVMIKFSRTLPDGSFSISAPKPGKYILLITYPGYADYEDFIQVNAPMDLGHINLFTKAVLLQNVIVRGSAVRMKGDTLAFMADSFKVKEGSTVEDLLKRLPGLSVNNKGEITAQGEKVQKVLVDGDEFFGDDPTLATRNLQANAVKEVQVFEKKSDQANFTGVDDGQSQKTINLKLKDEFKRGYFGKVKLGGGLPTRFENQAMVNAFKDKRKLSFYGIAANTPNNSLGWSEENQFGGNLNNDVQVSEDGGVTIWSQSDEFGGTGAYYGEGLPTSWSLGTSYGNKWDSSRSNVTGAYRYQHMKTEANTTNYTQYILPDTQYFNNQKGQSIATRWRHKASAKSELFIDSSQSLTIMASGSYGESDLHNKFLSEALTSKQVPVNTSERSTSSKGMQSQFNATALWKYKFKKKGRTLSASLQQQFNENDADGYLLTYNQFYTDGQLLKKDTIDQKKTNNTNGTTSGTRIAYTEPLSKNAIVEFSYGYNISNSHQERLSYDKVDGKYDDLNKIYSNDFKFKTQTNRTGIGYAYSYKNWKYGFGGDVAFTNWHQQDLVRDTTRNYNFTNFFPKANLNYKLGQYSRIRINYNGSTQAPTANQLQPVADNTDPLNVYVGNPNLKQAFNHRIEISYNFWKVLTSSGFWMGAWFSPTSNAFSTRDSIDNLGRKLYQTVNVNGNYSFNSYMGYNFKWKKPDISFDLSFNPTWSKTTNFVNGEENHTSTSNPEFGINAYKQKDEKYSVSLNQNVNYYHSVSSIRPDVVTKYWTSITGFDGNVNITKKIVISSEVNYNWRQKTDVFSNNNNAFIWNAGIETKLMKKQDMKVGFRIMDILNQNVGFRRDITSNYISERTYDVVSRYWLLTLNWNFNKGPQKAESDNW